MFNLVSPWPWVAHLVSGLILATERPIQTRFRYGSGCHSLNLATKINSQAHSPKGTPSGIAARTRLSPEHRPAISPSTVCKLTVSGSFHSPRRGSFHLSLTVLVHYRSLSVFSLGEWTPQIPAELACSAVLRCPAEDKSLSHTGLSPSMVGFSIPFC